MTKEAQNSNTKKYDLYERTSIFGEQIIDFLKTVKKDDLTKPIINQLVRSATSIGANYMEADCAESKKDFRHKISICKKEAKETTHWLRMLARIDDAYAPQCRQLWSEATELTLIFAAIVKKVTTSL